MIEKTQIGQIFMTVQPSQQRMNQELDSYLEPHYDPSSLTVNLHLSPLDYKGCDPKENGLLVVKETGQQETGQQETTRAPRESEVHPTPQGAVVVIWDAGEGTPGCLHTGNNISKGERVVLCTFFKMPKELRGRIAASRLGSLSMRPS